MQGYLNVDVGQLRETNAKLSSAQSPEKLVKRLKAQSRKYLKEAESSRVQRTGLHVRQASK